MATWTTRLFDEIAVGESACYARTLDAADIELLVMLTGDRIGGEANHRPVGAASTHAIGGSVLLATVSRHAASRSGRAHCEQTLRFHGRLDRRRRLTARSWCARSALPGGNCCSTRSAATSAARSSPRARLLVDCPAERHQVERLGEVEVAFHRYNAFQAIFERVQGQPPVTTAVVHPCDQESLQGALEAAAKGLIIPVLVGPEAKIRAAAAAASIDLARRSASLPPSTAMPRPRRRWRWRAPARSRR